MKHKEAATEEVLSDEQCEFIVKRILWSMRSVVPAGEFYQNFGVGLDLSLSDRNRSLTFGLIRSIARPAVARAQLSDEDGRAS